MRLFIPIGLVFCLILLICSVFYHFWINHPNRAFLELNTFIIIGIGFLNGEIK